MRRFAITLLGGLFLFGLILPPSSNASDWDKKTIMTFRGSVMIPGGTILPPGTYVIKRTAPSQNPDVISFWNADETKVLATCIAIPAERMEPTSDTRVEFAEIRSDGTPAIKKWWYPGDLTGEEFVYPKESNVLASNTESETTTIGGLAPQPPPAPEQTEPMKPAEPPPPAEQPAEVAQATPPTPPEPAPVPATSAPPEMPKTASDLPLLALLGAAALAGSSGLKALLKVRS